MKDKRFSIREAAQEAAAVLRAANVVEARRDALLLLGFALKRDKTFLLTRDEEQLSVDDARLFRDLIARRARHEPVQYITGRQEFFSLEFEVTPDVLIPRPETELIVETALELIKEIDVETPRILDVGTGSGCIIVSILHAKESACGTAIDVSSRALEVARRNAARYNVARRLKFIESDCFAALDASCDKFEFIVSNPPYVSAREIEGLQREVKDYEPRIALTPGETANDGLTVIRRLLGESPAFLSESGFLIFEVGYNQRERVESLIDENLWTTRDVLRDLQSIPRAFVLRKRA